MWEALRPVVALVLGVLIDLVRHRARPTAENADPDTDTAERLREQVRAHWLVPVGVLLAVSLPAGGCTGGAPFTRTIYVPHGIPVRLRETAKGVRVWVKAGAGESVAGKMDLPEGWYVLPLVSGDGVD